MKRAIALNAAFSMIVDVSVRGVGRKGLFVTIYSQHPNRGKIQILATYRGPLGVLSSTVTSVDDATASARIVDALNRISACATVPLSVSDRRHGRFDNYPREHLAAVADPGARADLLVGAHSLWYEHVKVLLHRALTDLDDATADLPVPVRSAVTAEVEKEMQDLRDAVAEHEEGVAQAYTTNPRKWDPDAPFVLFDGGMEELSDDHRKVLDRLERGATDLDLEHGIRDMRLLTEVHSEITNQTAMLVIRDLHITDDPDPYGPDPYYVDVLAPLPSGEDGRDSWSIDIGRWDLDDPEKEFSLATGETVLSCSRPAPPALYEIVELLNRSGGRPEQLRDWAKTQIGEVLAGTSFVVTKRFDDA